MRFHIAERNKVDLGEEGISDLTQCESQELHCQPNRQGVPISAIRADSNILRARGMIITRHYLFKIIGSNSHKISVTTTAH